MFTQTVSRALSRLGLDQRETTRFRQCHAVLNGLRLEKKPGLIRRSP